MKNSILIPAMVLFAFLFVQCKRCKQAELSDKKFTQEELNILPYTGNEKLVFKDSQDDSVCYTGQGRVSTMKLNHAVMDWDGEECQGDYRQVEWNEIKFKSDSSDTTISISIYFYHPFNDYENDKMILFDFSYPNPNGQAMLHSVYSFEAGSLMDSKHGQGHYVYVSAFHNTITLGNNTYSSVYELRNSYYENQPLDVTTLYYSLLKGIVGYKKISGTIWYLN